MSDLFSGFSDADLDNVLDDVDIRIQNKQQHDELTEEQQRIEAERAERRQKSKDEFAYFCNTYMKDAFPIAFADYQLALTRLVQHRTLQKHDELLFKNLIYQKDHAFIKPPESGLYDGILDLEPRDHGKTTRNTQAMPLWLALNVPGTFVVICAASKESAEDMLDAIKAKLEDDDQIIDDYGMQKVRGNTWSKRKIQLANGSSIAAVGRGQRLRGIKNKFQRPTHIICDDLLDDQEVESATQRRKAYNWFKRVILNLGQGALTIIANTVMHPADLPSTLLKEIEEDKLPNWLGLRFKAITPAGESLFPGRWPLEALYIKQRTLGALWFIEWMNDPIADEDKVFKEEMFAYFNGRSLDLRDCDVGMAVDPATGVEDGDYSFIAVVAKHRPTGIYYVLYADGWRESDLDFANRIVDVYCMFPGIQWVRFETVQFQAIYKREVMRVGSQRGVRLPMVDFKGTNKFLRIKSLGPYVQNKLLIFQEHQTLLLDMFKQFPQGHDDGPDAVEMAVSGFETGDVIGGASVYRKRAYSVAQKMASIGGRAFGKFRR